MLKKLFILYLVLAHILIAVLITKTDTFAVIKWHLGYHQQSDKTLHYINSLYAFQTYQNAQMLDLIAFELKIFSLRAHPYTLLFPIQSSATWLKRAQAIPRL